MQAGTTARQQVVTGVLESIAETAKTAGIQTPAITVVGDVVTLQRQLSWLGGKALLETGTADRYEAHV